MENICYFVKRLHVYDFSFSNEADVGSRANFYVKKVLKIRLSHWPFKVLGWCQDDVGMDQNSATGNKPKRRSYKNLKNSIFCYNHLTSCLPITTIVPHANSLDPGETPSNLASHPDPTCLTLGLQTRHLADDIFHDRIKVKETQTQSGRSRESFH